MGKDTLHARSPLPKLLPHSVREAPEYAPCSVCPKRETALVCHAIPTVFPFLEDLNRFLSYEKVLAIYHPEPSDISEGESVLHVARTSVHRALQHVSILSLLYYCEVGRAYFKYFAGVIPFMDPLLLIERVYLNIYWDLHGDLKAINACIEKMRYEMNITVHCQMERLHLLCESDAFLNAFVNTHIITQFLETDIDKLLREKFGGRKPTDGAPDSV